jgi:hypothetical protein
MQSKQVCKKLDIKVIGAGHQVIHVVAVQIAVPGDVRREGGNHVCIA